MDAEEVIELSIKDIKQIKSPVFADERGFFKEILKISQIGGVNKDFVVKQVSHARSSKNVLRGIHIAPWNKLIYVAQGTAQVVIVDLRQDSPTFGKYESIVLGESNRSCIFVPAYFGNSYLALSNVDYVYMVDQEWEPNKEKSVIWNDPTLAIKWQLTGEPILSEKDKNNPLLTSVFNLPLDKCK